MANLRVQRRRGKGSDDGASLVEFALILPVLVMLLLGTITGGFALATKNSMTNAVREGARLGATLPKGTGTWEAWAAAVSKRVEEISGNDLAQGQVCVAIVKKGASSTSTLGTYPASSPPAAAPAFAQCALSPATAPPVVPANTPVDACVVLVWGTRNAEIETLVKTIDLDLVAKAVARYERSTCS